MVIWVNKNAVRAHTDQRATVLEATKKGIHIRLLGNDERFTVQPCHVVGVEINDYLTIDFTYTGIRTCESRCRSCRNQE